MFTCIFQTFPMQIPLLDREKTTEMTTNIFGDLSSKDSIASQEVYDICDTFLATYCIHK